MLGSNPALGGSSWFKLEHLNAGTLFLTSSFDLRLIGSDSGGNLPCGTIPVAASLALAATAMALMAGLSRRRRAG